MTNYSGKLRRKAPQFIRHPLPDDCKAFDLQYSLSGHPSIDLLTEQAIARLQEHEPPEGYYLAFSGGKDSIVIYDLAVRAGVAFEAHYHKTTVDPPEVMHFIRDHYPGIVWTKPRKSMFRLIFEHKMVPTRTIRYCCRELKEIHGLGRTVILGVRRAESVRRKDRQVFEQSRLRQDTFYCCPIVDWSTQGVWDYIRARNLPYCSLYDEGKTRIGCIMCPMQGTKGMLIDAERYPKYTRAYLKAIRKMLDAITEGGGRIHTRIHTGGSHVLVDP